MDVLQFEGVVCNGMGRFNVLEIPGRAKLPVAPADWPEVLTAGSLNVRIIHNGFPTDFTQRGLAASVVAFDQGVFEPEFEIGWDQIGNNTLTPTSAMPRRGDAQVWRAEILLADGRSIRGCWMLRRIGSRVGEQLEFVAGRRLRDDELSNCTLVRVLVYGRWRDA